VPRKRDQRRCLAVQVGDRQLVARSVIVADQFLAESFARRPRDTYDGLAGLPVQNRQVLGSGLHAAVGVAGIAFARLHSHLGLAVAVQIVDDVGRVPDPLLDRPTQIVPPQKPAVAPVRLQLVRPGARPPIPRTPVGIDVGVGLLDYEIIPAVAVEIGDADFLKRVLAVQLDRDVGQHLGTGHGLRFRFDGPFLAARHRAQRPNVLDAGAGRGVDEIGRLGDRPLVQLHGRFPRRRTVDGERPLRRIGHQQPPTEIHPAAVHRPSDQTAVDLLMRAGAKTSSRSRRPRSHSKRHPQANRPQTRRATPRSSNHVEFSGEGSIGREKPVPDCNADPASPQFTLLSGSPAGCWPSGC
jgi:hypothetical protein